METLVLIIHVTLAIILIAMILLQQGKGADAGASFGSGASQTVFGSQGSSGFLVKMTAAIATLLLVTSLSLDLLTKHKAKRESDGNITLPTSTQKKTNTQSDSDVPAIKQPSVDHEKAGHKEASSIKDKKEASTDKSAAHTETAQKSNPAKTTSKGTEHEATGKENTSTAAQPVTNTATQPEKNSSPAKTETNTSSANKKTTEAAEKKNLATKQNDYSEHNSTTNEKKQP